MRYPATHGFLKWAGPSLLIFIATALGLIAAFAAAFEGVKTWAEEWFAYMEPTLTAPWFLALCVVLILGYIAALVWTGRPPKPEPDPIPAAPIIVGPEDDTGRAAGIGSSASRKTNLFDAIEERYPSESFIDKMAEANAPGGTPDFTDDRLSEKDNRVRQEVLRRASEAVKAGWMMDIMRRVGVVAPRPRKDMTHEDYWGEFGAKWVGLLFLRDEFGQAKPEGYWQTAEGINAGFNLLNKLRQAAVEEEIIFRGRRFDYDRSEMIAETVPLTKIPPTHFEDNGFMLSRFLEGESNYQTFTGGVLERVDVGLYRDIQANREQLEAWIGRYRKEQSDG